MTVYTACNSVDTSTLQESCHQYWPKDKGGTLEFDKLKVTLLSEETKDDITTRKMELSKLNPTNAPVSYRTS